MKSLQVTFGSVVFLAVFNAGAAWAGATYEASLKAGDEHRQYGRFDQAIAEYATALTQVASPTQTALALSKTASVQARDLDDCAAAKEAAEKALAIADVEPVGRVTALESLAICLIQDRNYVAASAKLEEALALTGVDWARPSLMILIGDSYRLSGRFEEAIAVLGKLAADETQSTDLRSVANLNIALTQQYGLKNATLAREYYEKAAILNPSLTSEIEGHTSKLP